MKGKFKNFKGALVLEGDTLKAANSTLRVKSIDTGVEKRDDHLCSADFLDAAKLNRLNRQQT